MTTSRRHPPVFTAAAVFVVFGTLCSAAALGALPDALPAAAREQPESAPGFLVLPILYRTPETGWAGGVGGVATFRLGPDPASPRPSSALFALTYTQKKQIIFSVRPEIYLDRERIAVAGTIEANRYPGLFYGLGPDTPDEAEEVFTPVQVLIELTAVRKVSARLPLYAGLLFGLESYHFSSFAEGGLLASGSVPGTRGGTSPGLGLAARWDSRDSVFTPGRGNFWQVSAASYGGPLGGPYGYVKFKADLRTYMTVLAGPVLAFQAKLEAVAGDSVPFTACPKLGGDSLLRGYYSGRYRDRVYAAAQTELRLPVSGRFGAVLFVSAGAVAGRIAGLGDSPLRAAWGGGLRYRLTSDGPNLRVDFGFGRGGNKGLYFTAGEAF